MVELTEAGGRLRRAAAGVPVNPIEATGLPPAQISDLRERAVAFTEAVTAAQPRRERLGGTT